MLFLADCLKTFCQWSVEGNAKLASQNCTITACFILTSAIEAVETLTLDANGIGVHSREDRKNVSRVLSRVEHPSRFLAVQISTSGCRSICPCRVRFSNTEDAGSCTSMHNLTVYFLGIVNRLQRCSSLFFLETRSFL